MNKDEQPCGCICVTKMMTKGHKWFNSFLLIKFKKKIMNCCTTNLSFDRSIFYFMKKNFLTVTKTKQMNQRLLGRWKLKDNSLKNLWTFWEKDKSTTGVFLLASWNEIQVIMVQMNWKEARQMPSNLTLM